MAPNSAAPRAPRASGGWVCAAPSALSWHEKLVRSELRPWSCNTTARAARSLGELVLSSCSLAQWAEVTGEGSCAPTAAGQEAQGLHSHRARLPSHSSQTLARMLPLGSLASLKRFWQASLWTGRQVLDRPPKLAGLLTSEECQRARWTSSILPYSHGDTRQIAFYKYVIIHMLWLQLWPSWVWLCVRNCK